jgi:hypothetical protein
MMHYDMMMHKIKRTSKSNRSIIPGRYIFLLFWELSSFSFLASWTIHTMRTNLFMNTRNFAVLSSTLLGARGYLCISLSCLHHPSVIYVLGRYLSTFWWSITLIIQYHYTQTEHTIIFPNLHIGVLIIAPTRNKF